MENEIIKEIRKECNFYEKIILKLHRKVITKVCHKERIILINSIFN